MASPYIVKPTSKHTATVIFLHGLGDSGAGWSQILPNDIRLPYIKWIFPNAKKQPVTLNGGFSMPAWYDITSLDKSAPTDKPGLDESLGIVEGILSEEIKLVPSERIVLGGFSQGGAVTLYSLQTKRKLAGFVGLSTYLPEAESVLKAVTVNKDTPIWMGHGDADNVVNPKWGSLSHSMLKTRDFNVSWSTYPGMGHSSCASEHEDIKDFLMKVIPEQE